MPPTPAALVRVLAAVAAWASCVEAVPAFSARPLSTVDPATLVKPVPRGKNAPAQVTWLDPSATPKPTAEWWENMVLTKSDIDGNGNGFVIPYIIDPKPYGLKLAVPFPLAVSSEIYENAFDTIVLVSNFGTADDFDGGYHVGRHDKLTVDLHWGQDGKGMMCTLSRGSPYVTCSYDGVRPSFNAPQMLEKFSVDNEDTPCDKGEHTGSRFEISFIQSDETWVVYTEKPLTMTCISDAASMSLTASADFTGVVRAAMANNCTMGRSAFHCNKRPPADPQPPIFMKYLDEHAHVYPVAGDLAFSTDEAASTGAVHFRWSKAAFEGSDAATPLLMLQMVHHRSLPVEGSTRVLDSPAAVSIHGPSYMAYGDEWRVEYALPSIMWHAPRDPDPERMPELMAQLEKDMDWVPPKNYRLGAGDPYNAGKMLSRMARTALIAEHVGRVDVVAHMLKKLEPLAEIYFNGTADNYLLYDHSWGGLVSCGCIYDDCGGDCDPHCNDGGDPDFCPSLGDPGMDFGNGYYNDHHFHYGYHLYAAAAIAHLDPSWGARHRDQILLFARDFVNPSVNDTYFPVFRNKDWFMGFSWASGIALAAGQPFRNGRNQESTSESINAYYALQLMGDALNDTEMKAIGMIATAAEIHSAAIYWHLEDGNPVYPPEIVEKRMLGILWQNLAQYQTWFGGQAFMVHGIQMIPVTPISELNHPAPFTKVQYPVFAQSCGGGGQCLTDGWVTFAVMNHAVLDKTSAWSELAKLPDSVFSGQSPAGNGNSRVNTMYWIATRPEPSDPVLAVGRMAVTDLSVLFGVLTSTTLVVVGVMLARKRVRIAARAQQDAAAALLERDPSDSTAYPHAETAIIASS